LDFDLFGYNSTEYINYVKPTKKKKKSKNGWFKHPTKKQVFLE
jgi:hypothetical protein